ncbi:MAG TPA: C25 family cysteine peptidase [Candidatus Polarisedimenticolia bacterium]|nr:C25 family cysteine peptidase [Candidatus Polarisedimenticolia bacterium]
MRDQRFVEVIHQPLLYNAARRQALFFPRIEAEIRFASPATDRGAGDSRKDARFEEAYRRAFVNYAQGRAWRKAPSAAAADAGPMTESAVAAPLPAAGGTTRYKLSVSQPGIYRIDQAWLALNAPDLVAADPRTLSVAVDGVEVPIAILDAAGGSGEADGAFGAGDRLVFYGGPKIESPTILNIDPGGGQPLIYELNDFTDTQVYWLASSGAPGSHARMTAAAVAPVSGYALAVDFPENALWDENNLFVPIGAGDPYVSMPSLLAGSTPQRDIAFPLPGLAPGAATATVTATLRGGSTLVANPDHRTKFWANNDLVNVADYTWDGEIDRVQALNLPQTSLTNPVTIHLQAPGLSGVTVDRQYPQTISVAYRRTFAATGQALLFRYPNQNARFTVTGLDATAPTLFEVSRPLANGEPQAVRLTGATPGGAPTTTWTFEVAQDNAPGAPTTRTFIVAGPSGLRIPDAVTAAADPTLAIPGQSADYLVIAAPQAIDASPGGALDLLLAHRLAGQGLTSRVITIDRIYDEFSGGRRDANAVRAFLTYAFANWRGPSGTEAPPAYVLLVGDASLDFKNTLQRVDWVDQVPTPIMVQYSNLIGYYSSDNWLASCNGPDQIPDLVIGRISTRTAAESSAVFDKIRLAETAPPAGTWKGRAVLSAGESRQPDEHEQFEAVNDVLRQKYFTAAPYSTPAPPLYFEQPPWNATDPAGFHAALVGELQNGPGIATYVGHGAFDVWGLDTFFTTADAAGLTNGLKLPFVMNSNCLSGGFHFLLGSGAIAEGFVNNPNGGARAVFAPSGLSTAFVGMVVANQLFEPLYGRSRNRELGTATLPARVALAAQNSIVDLQSYTFMGDPASLGPTPAPAAPTALQAQAGNGEVTLSWTPPQGPASSTRIYRATGNAAATYAPITCTPAGANSCIDQSAVNATRYYYAAVSVDPEGFEGAWSNLNLDCDAGPGCVTARPFNPNPPAAPAGVVVGDPGSGGRLIVTWNLPAEDDLKLFTVRYGTTSGVYTATETVTPPTLTASLTGLQNGTRYYVVVTSTNTSDLVSPPSAEHSGVPHLFEGIAPPRSITDLTVSRSGSDLVLTWSRPTLDIYGRATTTTGYRVYRGTTPNYVPIGSAPLATLNNGATTSYTHVGGATLAGSSFYFVTALDATGLESGAGHDLPSGVGDLVLTFTAPSNVHLVWSPVSTDVQGRPTLVHYQIHSTATPVGRLGLGPGTLLLDNVTGNVADLNLPANPRYLSVLTVDTRGNLSPY